MTVEPCIDDSGCGIDIAVSATGRLSLGFRMAFLPCNGIVCDADDRLFLGQDESNVQAGTLPDGGVGWGPLDLDTFIVGLPIPVASLEPVNMFTNESSCFEANVIEMVAQREIEYAGPEGAHFRVSVQRQLDAGPYIPFLVLNFDYRFTSTAPGGLINDKRPGGCAVGGRVLAPSQVMSYSYRIFVTLLNALPSPGTPHLIQSSGLTYSWFSETN